MTSFVNDEQKKEVTKIVAKLDQILEGTNKQDGLTVLGLLEACLLYLHKEFPGLCVEYIKSDNAAAYHLKELVLAIPTLNQVSFAYYCYCCIYFKFNFFHYIFSIQRTENEAIEWVDC